MADYIVAAPYAARLPCYVGFGSPFSLDDWVYERQKQGRSKVRSSASEAALGESAVIQGSY